MRALCLLFLLSVTTALVSGARKQASVNVGAGGEVALAGGSAEASDGLVLVQRELDTVSRGTAQGRQDPVASPGPRVYLCAAAASLVTFWAAGGRQSRPRSRTAWR